MPIDIVKPTPAQIRIDALAGMAWWNALSEVDRARWLETARKRNQLAAGHVRYTLDDIPSAADAWAAFKA